MRTMTMRLMDKLMEGLCMLRTTSLVEWTLEGRVFEDDTSVVGTEEGYFSKIAYHVSRRGN